MTIFELKTIQSSSIRVLIEALKEIITDVNIIIDESGLKIKSMDSAHSILVHLKLEADKFEEFYCKEKLVIGLNMINLFKLIKTMTNNDTLTLFVNEDETDKLGIKIENSDKNSISTYKLNLMDLDNDSFDVDPTTFNYIITMPSIDFQKICRDMSNLSDVIEIQSVSNQIRFSCKGDFAELELIRGESANGLSFVKCNDCNNSEIVQGLFLLKKLITFTKCTGLSNTVDIYLKNNYPLVICYNVGCLGELKLCLAPKVE